MHINRVALFFLFWCLLGMSNDIFGQYNVVQSSDSLRKKTYKYLFDSYYENSHDTLISKLYLKAYLDKATVADHKINKAIALNALSYYEVADTDKLTFIKQSLLESNSIDSLFSVEAYINLGIYYYKRFDYEQALQEYFRASELAKKRNDKTYEAIALNNIADVKADIGEHEEALHLYKKCLSIENSKKQAYDQLIVGYSLNCISLF